MGKTSLLRKAEQLLTEHVVVQISAETEKLDLFGPRLLELLRGHSVFADELKRWKMEVDVGYQGIRLRRRSGDGPGRAEDSDDLFTWAAARAAPTKLVVIIDEVTVLVTAIEQQHPGGAAEFLRSLRRPRQELPNVAVILSGSIGLHHAVYGADAELALHLLDAYAVADGPLDVDALAARLGSTPLDGPPSRDELIRLVESLESDNYLTRRSDVDEFAFRLLRDAWRSMRRLG